MIKTETSPLSGSANPMKWTIFLKSNFLSKILWEGVVMLPSPINISNLWNMGSMLGILLMIQILTGLTLASHYSPQVSMAFFSIDHIGRDVNWGWLLRITHLNSASFFFLCLFLHIGRGLYYGSFSMGETWNLGVVIFFLAVITAFMGYVLPWGQMSFWGATVITNLLSALPLIGKNLVLFMWGGFSVGGPTLSRFFMLHFCLPFILSGVVILHLFFLHTTGSTNPSLILSKTNLISFHWFFSSKDVLFFFFVFLVIEFFVFFFPFFLGDPENFILANPMSTPTHIVPEWYFLFAYAILRSIPNKLLGVIFLALSILILFIPPLVKKGNRGGLPFNPNLQGFFFCFLSIFGILTWLGGQVVEEPFILLGQTFLTLYFLVFFLLV